MNLAELGDNDQCKNSKKLVIEACVVAFIEHPVNQNDFQYPLFSWTFLPLPSWAMPLGHWNVRLCKLLRFVLPTLDYCTLQRHTACIYRPKTHISHIS
jgi:hypothetical protein